MVEEETDFGKLFSYLYLFILICVYNPMQEVFKQKLFISIVFFF